MSSSNVSIFLERVYVPHVNNNIVQAFEVVLCQMWARGYANYQYVVRTHVATLIVVVAAWRTVRCTFGMQITPLC